MGTKEYSGDCPPQMDLCPQKWHACLGGDEWQAVRLTVGGVKKNERRGWARDAWWCGGQDQLKPWGGLQMCGPEGAKDIWGLVQDE